MFCSRVVLDATLESDRCTPSTLLISGLMRGDVGSEFHINKVKFNVPVCWSFFFSLISKYIVIYIY